MKNVKKALWLIAVLSIGMISGPKAWAQETGFVKTTPDKINWMPVPFLPEGAQLAVIKGNPNESGPFTIRLKFPAGYEIPAHKHPSYEHITVLSGTLYMGMGKHLEQANSVELPDGSFAYGPKEKHHFAYTTKEETVVQIQSQGPFAIHYFDPNDDPTTTDRNLDR